jgi:hypothetical protein
MTGRTPPLSADWALVRNASGIRQMGVRHLGVLHSSSFFLRLSKAVQDPPMSLVEGCKRHVPVRLPANSYFSAWGHSTSCQAKAAWGQGSEMGH